MSAPAATTIRAASAIARGSEPKIWIASGCSSDGDPQVAERLLVPVLDPGAGDHLRADEPGAVAAALAAERLDADTPAIGASTTRVGISTSPIHHDSRRFTCIDGHRTRALLTFLLGRRYHPPPPDGSLPPAVFVQGLQEDRSLEGSHSHARRVQEAPGGDRVPLERQAPRDRGPHPRARGSSATSPRTPSTTRRRTSRPISRPHRHARGAAEERARRHEEGDQVGRGLGRHEGAPARRQGDKTSSTTSSAPPRRTRPRTSSRTSRPSARRSWAARRARRSRSPRRAASSSSRSWTSRRRKLAAEPSLTRAPWPRRSAFPTATRSPPSAPRRSRSRTARPAETKRRLAGRVMARRDMGKLVFLDLVDRSGRIQLLCPVERTGEIDVHLGDVVGVTGSPAKSRRGEPSLQVDSLELLSRIRTPLPDTFHGLTDVEQRYRKRHLDLLMNEESRADALVALARGRGDPPHPRRVGLRRGRDAGAAAALRRRVRRAVRHALERARRGPLPAHRDRALPQAADRRRAREGLRDRQGLPQRGRLVQAPPGVHDARVVRGVRGLQRHDGAHRAARLAHRAGGARHDEGDVPGRRDRLRAAVAAREVRRRARRARPLDARRGRAARSCSRSATSTSRTTRRGRS